MVVDKPYLDNMLICGSCSAQRLQKRGAARSGFTPNFQARRRGNGLVVPPAGWFSLPFPLGLYNPLFVSSKFFTSGCYDPDFMYTLDPGSYETSDESREMKCLKSLN